MAFRRINVDWPLIGAALALTLFGIAMVYSAGLTDGPKRGVANAYKAQAIWFLIAITAAFLLSRATSGYDRGHA